MSKKFFISFSTEERELCEFITNELRLLFKNYNADFFISSKAIEPGEDWLLKIQEALKNCDIILPILSERSINKPWLNIEMGAFWFSNKSIIPLTHSRLRINEIHRPISDFQVVNLRNKEQVKILVNTLSNKLGLEKIPEEFDAEKFCRKIKEFDKKFIDILKTWQDVQKSLKLTIEKNAEDLSDYRIINEKLSINGQKRKINGKNEVLEIGGYAKEAAIIRLEKNCDISSKKYLILKIENAEECISENFDKLLKITVNNNLVKPYFEYNRHYDDPEYIYKEDGYFVYNIDFILDTHLSCTLVFWRIRMESLRIKFYLI